MIINIEKMMKPGVNNINLQTTKSPEDIICLFKTKNLVLSFTLN